jgi:hypothetical protein
MTARDHAARSRTLWLPRVLDAAVAATLATTLRACRGEDVVIDAEHVRVVGARAAEALRWAARIWELDRRALIVVNDGVDLFEGFAAPNVAAA